jgi:hypothetical protein
VRFTHRSPAQVVGLLTTPDGPIDFTYDPSAMIVQLPTERIQINEHGWELDKELFNKESNEA